MVGAVVVSDGVVVGEGYHAEFGGPHAEIVALSKAGPRARGATLYVTLEPCAHHGKTPPCTAAILEAGVGSVVFAASDPHPEAGGGARVLREHGIDTIGGVEEEAARALDPAFFHVLERRTCYLALKLALSLDAKLSRAGDVRTRLTGVAAEQSVHRLRAGFDAIMVGIGTVLADDPLLTVRSQLKPRAAPVRVILDTAGRLPPESKLARGASEAPVWMFCGLDADADRIAALDDRGVRVFRVRAREDGVALDVVLDTLWQQGVRRVLCEGGARTAASFMRLDRVERLYLYYAPVILGVGGVAAFPLEPQAPSNGHWRLQRARRYGNDFLLMFDRYRSEA